MGKGRAMGRARENRGLGLLPISGEDPPGEDRNLVPPLPTGATHLRDHRMAVTCLVIDVLLAALEADASGSPRKTVHEHRTARECIARQGQLRLAVPELEVMLAG